METRNAVAALAALGHELRLELWQMLVPLGPDGLSAGTIAVRLSMSPASLSFHLQQMTQAGVLVQRRSSRNILYAVNGELIGALRAFLASGGDQMIHVPSVPSSGQAGDILGKR